MVVIIAARDAADTLGAALASVAGQSWRPAQVVVVDDASTDATASVAESWADRLAIRVLRSDDSGGPAPARNRAILSSEQPLIAPLDADDVWLPNHVEALFRTHQRMPGLITANAHRWVPALGIETRTWRKLQPIPPPAEQRLALHDRNFVFNGTLFDRGDFLRAGGYRTGVSEDWDLWIRMARLGVRVVGVEEPTVLYRVHPEGAVLVRRRLQRFMATAVRAAAEARDDDERKAALRAWRRLRASRHLLDADEAVRVGALREARAHARRALGADLTTAVKALALAAAPAAAVALHERRASPVDRWMRSHLDTAARRSDSRDPVQCEHVAVGA